MYVAHIAKNVWLYTRNKRIDATSQILLTSHWKHTRCPLYKTTFTSTIRGGDLKKIRQKHTRSNKQNKTHCGYYVYDGAPYSLTCVSLTLHNITRAKSCRISEAWH